MGPVQCSCPDAICFPSLSPRHTVPITAPASPDLLHSTTAILLETSLKHQGSMSPERHTERSEGHRHPSPSENPPNRKAPDRATRQHLKGQGKRTIGCRHPSYSHPSLLQQDWVLHRPQKKILPRGWGGMGSPSWHISTQRRPRSMGPCRLGLHGQHLHLAWTQECLLFAGGGGGGVCVCLVAFKGSPSTEQDLNKTRLVESLPWGSRP